MLGCPSGCRCLLTWYTFVMTHTPRPCTTCLHVNATSQTMHGGAVDLEDVFECRLPILRAGERQRDVALQGIALNLEAWSIQVKREKGVYYTLNKFSVDVTRKVLNPDLDSNRTRDVIFRQRQCCNLVRPRHQPESGTSLFCVLAPLCWRLRSLALTPCDRCWLRRPGRRSARETACRMRCITCPTPRAQRCIMIISA